MEEQLAAAMRPKRRRAPNGDTLDAQEFLESIGQSTLRCSACELVAAKFEKAIDEELVAGWSGNTSAERAEALRTTLPKRACAKMKRMAIAMEGDEANLKYVDLTEGTDADFAAGDFGAMGLQHRETVRALCSNHNPHPHPRRTFNLTLTRCARSAPSSQRWIPSPWSLSLSTVSSRSQACGSTSSIYETRSASRSSASARTRRARRTSPSSPLKRPQRIALPRFVTSCSTGGRGRLSSREVAPDATRWGVRENSWQT